MLGVLGWGLFFGPDAGILNGILGTTAVLGGAAILGLAVARRGGGRLADAGFVLGGSASAAAWAVVVYAATVLPLGFLHVSWSAIVQQYGVDPVQEVATRIAESGAETRFWVCLSATLLSTLAEELFFRGLLQTAAVQAIGRSAGLVLVSILFAALHGWAAFVPLFALSIVIGGVHLRSGRLAAAWAVHAVHNGVNLWLMFFVDSVSP